MKVLTTLGVFGLGLTAVFGTALAVGRSVGPVSSPASTASEHGSGHGTAEPPAAAPGLSSSEGGYRLTAPTLTGGALSFTISGPEGRPLTAYTPTHTKDLHLIVVRRDLTGFRHVHPTRASDGTWSVPLTLSEPGPYRVFADFAPRGMSTLILGADLTVPGGYAPQAPTAVSETDTVDGYTVTIEGTLTAGSTSPLELEVSKGGRAVTDLQPYLGAFGHLVVLRRSDLAYLHVHPEEGAGLRFGVEVPSAGDYRLFLDFQHGGVVRTAGFTAHAR